jgi:uncharacterized membrane protein YeiH
MQLDPVFASYSLLAFEVLGVLAFALSGVIEAARKRFDLVGVVLIGAITAFGGGTLRDVLLDRRPFFWVENELWLWVLLAACVVLPFVFRARHVEFTSRAMLVPDALGLGVFTAFGTQIALQSGATPLVAVVMGLTTAVFGGVLRDVLVNEVPRVFSDHNPYATISFIGGWVVVLFWYLDLEPLFSVLIAALLMVLARVIVIRFGISLPRWKF